MAEATYINYQVAMIPENASKIDAVNRILLGGEYETETPKSATGQKKTAPAEKGGTTPTKKPAEKTSKTSTSSVTLLDVKNAAKKSKSEHGEEFTMQVLKDAGVAVGTTLGRSMSKIDEDQYAEVIAAWEAGPQTEASDDSPGDDDFDDDDGLGDDEDTSEVTVEAVKIALKAYAKETGRDEAKQIMNDNGAAALSKVDDCTQEQLQAMFKALV